MVVQFDDLGQATIIDKLYLIWNHICGSSLVGQRRYGLGNALHSRACIGSEGNVD